MSKRTNFPHGIRMSYKGVQGMLSAAAKGVKVYLTATPDDYYTANGDSTWTSAKTGTVVDSATLAHVFANIPEDEWVWELINGTRC